MPKIIFGMEQFGHQFKNDVIYYCQATGNPSTPESHTQIFHECLSQILAKMDADFQVFMTNLMMLPDWRTIHYLEEPINYQATAPFKDAVRAFAVLIWERLKNKGNLDQRYYYLLESCTDQYAVIGAYINADTV